MLNRPRKLYAGGRNKREQIIGLWPVCEHPSNVEKRSRFGHWEGDMLTGKIQKRVIVSPVEHKIGHAVLKKETKEKSEADRFIIITGLKSNSYKVEPITFEDDRKFSNQAKINEVPG